MSDQPCRTYDCTRPGVHEDSRGVWWCAVCYSPESLDGAMRNTAKPGYGRRVRVLVEQIMDHPDNPHDGSWADRAVKHLRNCEGCEACLPRG